MTREEVISTIRSARTLQAIEHAWHVRGDYLLDNPEDSEIFEYGESLSMMEDALRILESEEVKRPLPARR